MNPIRRRRMISSNITPYNVPGGFLHLDAAAITGVAPGASLTTWRDTSGNGRDATTPGVGVVPKYIFTATLPGGGDKGMVWYNPFDGTGSVNGGNFPESTIDQSSGWTYYLWFRSFDAASPQVLFQDGAAGNQPQLIWVSNGKFGWRDSISTHEIAAASTGYHSLIYVFSGIAGAGTGEVYFDGARSGSAAWNWSNAGVSTYLVGANQVNNAHWDGWMGELMGFAGAHSSAVRLGLHTYFANKWGWG